MFFFRNFQTYLRGFAGKQTERNTFTVEGPHDEKTYYYRVMAINEAGALEYSNTITVHSNPTNIASFQEPTVMVYPNPAKNYFFVETENSNGTGCNLEVFNLAGHAIYQAKTQSSVTRKETGIWQNGVYIVRIQGQAGPIMQKVVISR